MAKICQIDLSIKNQNIDKIFDEVWDCGYDAYHIYNVPETDYVSFYEGLAESLGKIRICHSANNIETNFSKSRDIKPNSDLYHYFASSTRQPLHNDFAYYATVDSPKWLMLYCLQPSEWGGKTHLLMMKTLDGIMRKYNPELLEKIQIDVTWEYTGLDGDKIHQTPIYDGANINWNYWQIKEELNSRSVMDIRQEFFDFLENVVVAGNIYDFSKKWNVGDCIIFNDHRTLHGRDAFLGDRWLKDHAFYEGAGTWIP